MKFTVEEKVFETLPDVCFGVVIAKGVDNTKAYEKIAEMLQEGVKHVEQRFLTAKPKEDGAILPYRDAFLSLGINPNKFMSSIEALFTRVSKGKGLPTISPIVDLGNALSLKYTLPMGAHDIGQMDGDMEVRFSRAGDTFLPFGEDAEEHMPEGELIYVVGSRVRTRRWIWRQSEEGKIGDATRDIFYPIDGFISANKEAMLAAQKELLDCCESIFGASDVRLGFIDKNNREIIL